MTGVRHAFADTVCRQAGAASPDLLAAFAAVPRERFLPPGPWLIHDAQGRRETATADPREVYADSSIAVDPARQLFNGQPSTIARWLEAVQVHAGDRVVHIGCGTGYYSAILATLAGRDGHVTAIEIDAALAASATANLQPWPWVEVRDGDGGDVTAADGRAVDVLIAHAGAAHVRGEWLAAMAPGGRLIVPLAVSLPGLSGTLGKGIVFAMHHHDDGWHARALAPTIIYLMQAARSADAEQTLAAALASGGWQSVTRLRLDDHTPMSSCWCHVPGSCLSS